MKTKDFFDKWIYPILVLDLKAKLCKTLIGSILYYLLIVGGFSAILFFRGVYIFLVSSFICGSLVFIVIQYWITVNILWTRT